MTKQGEGDLLGFLFGQKTKRKNHIVDSNYSVVFCHYFKGRKTSIIVEIRCIFAITIDNF